MNGATLCSLPWNGGPQREIFFLDLGPTALNVVLVAWHPRLLNGNNTTSKKCHRDFFF